MLRYLPLALLLVAAGCASTTNGQPAGTKLAANGNSDTTCRSYRETGSIMPGKRVCHTSAQWQAIDRQQQQETNALMGNNGRQSGTGGDLN